MRATRRFLISVGKARAFFGNRKFVVVVVVVAAEKQCASESYRWSRNLFFSAESRSPEVGRKILTLARVVTVVVQRRREVPAGLLFVEFLYSFEEESRVDDR